MVPRWRYRVIFRLERCHAAGNSQMSMLMWFILFKQYQHTLIQSLIVYSNSTVPFSLCFCFFSSCRSLPFSSSFDSGYQVDIIIISSAMKGPVVKHLCHFPFKEIIVVNQWNLKRHNIITVFFFRNVFSCCCGTVTGDRATKEKWISRKESGKYCSRQVQ